MPAILVGGGGTRLWPLSRPDLPKQFHALIGSRSLFGETLDRVRRSDVVDLSFAAPLIIAGARHRGLIAHELAAANLGSADCIYEPMGRNTAPAVAAAALVVAESDPETLMLVLPSDHHIADTPAFHEAVAAGAPLAEQGALVTFGIVPNHPETGYGYIRRGEPRGRGFQVDRFVEKPNRATAEGYLRNGNYDWNAGIFLFRAADMLDAMTAHAGDILQAVRAAVADGRREAGALHLDPASFARCRAEPIDTAVMEKHNDVAVVPAAMGWSDVGSWAALAEVAQTEGRSGRGRIIGIDSNGSYLRSDRGLVAAIGVENVAVIRSADAVLVARLDRAQDAKLVADQLASVSAPPAQPEGLDAESRRSLARAARRVRTWLFDHALPLWSSAGWDDEAGGFREHLSRDGRPCAEEFRRVRVQARQMFAFSAAHELGFPGDALAAAARGFEFLTRKCWLPEGGWAYRLGPDNRVVDVTRDTYDHAFAINALAWYYRVSGDPAAHEWAERTLAYLDAVLADRLHGGYGESVPARLPRRANPHMHLLEAILALFDACGDLTLLDRADALVGLCLDHFLDPKGSLIEHFAQDWRPAEGDERRIREPGHAYEWAWLLGEYQKRLGKDCEAARSGLLDFAESRGWSPKSGLVYDQVEEDGAPRARSHRLWPQTEAVRAKLGMLARGGSVGATDIETLVDRIFEVYLTPVAAGVWLDRVDEEGKPAPGHAPASTLYHVMTMAWDLHHMAGDAAENMDSGATP